MDNDDDDEEEEEKDDDDDEDENKVEKVDEFLLSFMFQVRKAVKKIIQIKESFKGCHPVIKLLQSKGHRQVSEKLSNSFGSQKYCK
jgi:TATA-binding protein-associated factor Taf7